MTDKNFSTRIFPKRIEPGDTIGIITPASPPYGKRAEYYQQGLIYLKNRGFRVLEGNFNQLRRGYLAGSDEARAQDLNDMFANPDVKAIFCTRGGYGTVRFLEQVDYDLIRKHPKILVGYSDITSLQLAIWTQTGLVTYSGPMVAVEMGKGIHPFTENHFWQILTESASNRELPAPDGLSNKIYSSGKAVGPLLGGCASLINPLLGTQYMPSLKGAILLLEDIGEESYRLDRYWAQLRLAGILQELAGVILGQFIDCEPDPQTSEPFLTIETLIYDYFVPLNIPIIGNFAYGHGEVKLTIPIGASVVLDADAGKVFVNEAVVA